MSWELIFFKFNDSVEMKELYMMQIQQPILTKSQYESFSMIIFYSMTLNIYPLETMITLNNPTFSLSSILTSRISLQAAGKKFSH